MRISYRAPNMSAIAERSVRLVKCECLDRIILFGEAHLRSVLDDYVAHHHRERPHRSLGNQRIRGRRSTGIGEVVEHERLGGLLRSDDRAA